MEKDQLNKSSPFFEEQLKGSVLTNLAGDASSY